MYDLMALLRYLKNVPVLDVPDPNGTLRIINHTTRKHHSCKQAI